MSLITESYERINVITSYGRILRPIRGDIFKSPNILMSGDIQYLYTDSDERIQIYDIISNQNGEAFKVISKYKKPRFDPEDIECFFIIPFELIKGKKVIPRKVTWALK